MALQGLPQRNLQQLILWKVAPSRMLVLQDQEWLQIWEKCSYAHRQVDEQPSKRSKKNDDKSAVAMLKKNELYESVWQLVVNRDKSHERSGTPDIKRDTCHVLKQGPVGRRSSNARQLGCVFQDMKPPKSILRKSSDCRNQSNVWNSRKLLHVTLKFETKILRSGIFAQVNLISAAPALQNLRIGLRRRQCGKSKVPRSGQKCIKITGARRSNILLTFGK